MNNKPPLRIAIAGLGTVGCGTIKLLNDNAELLAARCGRSLQVTAVSARSRSKDRGVDLSEVAWCDDPVALAARDDVDVVVELIGGSDGPAKALVEAALAAGKPLVTANKALVAHHGNALAALAEKQGVALAYEAAVAGGIPVIDALCNGLSANRFTKVAGILNGTGNYILTTMQKTGRSFEGVLKEAQDLGYAEADPSFDVDGMDTAHKLAILTTLAYGTPLAVEDVYCEGIRNITPADIRYADELGYVIKLLGVSAQTEAGMLQRVHPCLVSKQAAIGGIDGAFNAVHIEGDAVGRILLEGQGAGAGPTASSVVGDIVQVARGGVNPPFMQPIATMKAHASAKMESLTSHYYVRLSVQDQPGVLEDITACLANHQISVQSILQHDAPEDGQAEIVLTTHEASEAAMNETLQELNGLASVAAPANRIRMENL